MPQSRPGAAVQQKTAQKPGLQSLGRPLPPGGQDREGHDPDAAEAQSRRFRRPQGREEREAQEAQPFLLRLSAPEQGHVAPGGEAAERRRQKAEGQARRRVRRPQHPDALHREVEPAGADRGEAPLLRELRPLQGRHGGGDEDGGAQLDEAGGEIQEEGQSHAAAQQRRDASRSRARRRHAAQGEGGLPAADPGRAQRRRQEEAHAQKRQLPPPGLRPLLSLFQGSSLPCRPGRLLSCRHGSRPGRENPVGKRGDEKFSTFLPEYFRRDFHKLGCSIFFFRPCAVSYKKRPGSLRY